MSNPKRRPKIAIGFNQLTSYAARERLRGILRYERLNSQWDFLLDYHTLSIPSFDYQIADIAGYIGEERRDLTDPLIARDVPCVFFDPSPSYIKSFGSYRRYSCVNSDGRAIGVMGARHFLGQHFKNFAFIDNIETHDPSVCHWSRQRRLGFEEELRRRGHKCHIFDLSKFDPVDPKKAFRAWFTALPKPVGIMITTDERAQVLLRSCRELNFDVPEQVSILGVDNDELLCKSAGPSLSSVDVDNYRAGFLAAELLDSLIKGKIRSPRTVSYPPLMVVQRQSTEAPQYDDPLVNDVLLQIWSSRGCGFSIQEIADRQHVSRRILEARFRAQTGRSSLDEIQEVRLAYICSLLRRSENTIADIVKMCGFTSQCYLAQFFKKKMGKTMSDYRREVLGDDYLA